MVHRCTSGSESLRGCDLACCASSSDVVNCSEQTSHTCCLMACCSMWHFILSERRNFSSQMVQVNGAARWMRACSTRRRFCRNCLLHTWHKHQTDWWLDGATIGCWTCDYEDDGFTPDAINWLLLGCVTCLQTGRSSRYITNIKVNSTSHPSGVGKSSTSLSG